MILKLLLLVRLVDVTSFRKYQVNNIVQPQDEFTSINSFSEDIFDVKKKKIALTSQIISRCSHTRLFITRNVILWFVAYILLLLF